MVVLSDDFMNSEETITNPNESWNKVGPPGPLLSLRLVTIASITRVDDMYPLVI